MREDKLEILTDYWNYVQDDETYEEASKRIAGESDVRLALILQILGEQQLPEETVNDAVSRLASPSPNAFIQRFAEEVVKRSPENEPMDLTLDGLKRLACRSFH